MARFTITRAQAAAFAIRATTLVEAGRPPCPLCGGPLDPSGHECPQDQRPPAARHLTLLAEGDIEIVGRMPWSSNHTFLVTCFLGRRRGRARCTSPGRGRAPSVGLPRGDLPARGRRLRGVARPRVGHRSRDRRSATTRRSGPGSLQLFVARGLLPAPLHPHRGRGVPRPTAGDLRLRRRGEQRRSQERALHARRGRPDLGHRQRPVLPRRAQAAHGDLGVRRGASARRAVERAWPGWPRHHPRRCGALLSARRGPSRRPAGRACCSRPAGSRSPTPIPTTTPGPSSESRCPAKVGPAWWVGFPVGQPLTGNWPRRDRVAHTPKQWRRAMSRGDHGPDH